MRSEQEATHASPVNASASCWRTGDVCSENYEAGTGLKRRRHARGTLANRALMLAGALTCLVFGATLVALAFLLPGRTLPLGSLLVALALALGVAGCYAFGAWLFCHSFEAAKSLSYAPPVSRRRVPEAEAAFLLRGSDDDPAASLLRYAPTQPETASRELLRSQPASSRNTGQR